MEKDAGNERFGIHVTPKEAHEFLLKLCSDDAFRERLEKHPADVLAEHHIHIPIDGIPGKALLPKKEDLREALDRFTQAGELNLRGLFSADRWSFVLFWWLYMTPAKPPRRGKEGG